VFYSTVHKHFYAFVRIPLKSPLKALPLTRKPAGDTIAQNSSTNCWVLDINLHPFLELWQHHDPPATP
jgi:hypothetical protein